MVSQVLVNLGVYYLHHPGTGVVCMSRENKEVGATEEGKLRVPSLEDPEAAMPTLVI